MSVIKKETIDVRRIGTALIGGDFTGNARGIYAVDIQTYRSAATQVAANYSTAIGHRNTASGEYSTAAGYANQVTGYDAVGIGHTNISSTNNAVAIGTSNTASGAGSVAIGTSNQATELDTIAIGHDSVASGYGATAIGYENLATANYTTAAGYRNVASGTYSTALGYRAETRVEKTTNICGPQIIRKDDGESAGTAFQSFCGVEVILMSKEVDMKVVADHTLTLPANCKFWLNEIGIIARTVTDLVAQPTVRYGITGDLDKHNAAAITTALTAADKREIETPLVPQDGEVSLTGGITIAANATTFLGRFYWKGMFVEDE